MNMRFILSQPVKGNVRSFIFEPVQPTDWQPGQYFHYVLPHEHADDRGTERWFTNAAAPSEGHVMISTRIDAERSSSFKQALLTLRPGDEIETDGPEGDFTITDETRNYIFVAGGIGITPFRSILAEADAQKQKLNVTLLYANRDHEIPFSEELDKFAHNNPNLRIEYIVQPDRINAEVLKQHIEAVENPLVYISGPEPMVKDFSQLLTDLGLPPEAVKLDDFPGYEAD
jgi:glycine betaine catabolism B